MNILHIDEKWAVRFDPKNNDRPMEWLRNGNTQCEFDDNNAVVAMFYALKDANAALTKSQDIVDRWINTSSEQDQTIYELREALTQSRAETAAAYEVAAKAAMGHCYAIMSATDADARAALIAVSIRALATPDQSSALAAIEAAAEARGMRKAAELALQRKGDGTATLDHPYDKGYLAACDACAAAILALIGEKK